MLVFSLILSLFRIQVRFAFIMTLHLTINSYQPLFDESSASVAAPVHQSTNVGESITSAKADPSSGISLSPEIVALIAQFVQAAKVAKQAKTSTLLTMSFTPGAIGGVPMISTPTANVAQPSAGRPVSTSSVMVPSFGSEKPRGDEPIKYVCICAAFQCPCIACHFIHS